MKLHLSNNQRLLICASILIAACIYSISSPMRFNKEKNRREQIVKLRLEKIKKAEEIYRNATGIYANSFEELIKQGYLADSLQYIPFTNHEQFNIAAIVKTTKSGKKIPLMECSAGYHQYLNGLNQNEISNLIEKAGEEGIFPGLKIGDITTENYNAGNWE